MSRTRHIEFRLGFPYPALRERFAGVSAAEWLRGARLQVFAPVYAGTSKLAFHKENYIWPHSDGHVPVATVTGEKAMENAVLPSNPTPEQLEAYLDKVLFTTEDYFGGELAKKTEAKLVALGMNGLPALLRRLPLQSFESVALNAVAKLATRAQLPELLTALDRDSNLARVIVEKKWEADARPVLVKKLGEHRLPLPAEALALAAQAKDPATYPDLRWHFVRLEWGFDQVIPALERCPGFDLAGAVNEAWTTARLRGAKSAELAIAAAKLGLPDALTSAVMALESSGGSPRQSDLHQLARVTGYSGPATNTMFWLGSNLGRFEFDPTQQRYQLKSP